MLKGLFDITGKSCLYKSVFLHSHAWVFVVSNQSLENALRPFHVQVSERRAMQIQILKLLIENIKQIKNLTFKRFPLIYTSTTNFVGDVQSLSHVRLF